MEGTIDKHGVDVVDVVVAIINDRLGSRLGGRLRGRLGVIVKIRDRSKIRSSLDFEDGSIGSELCGVEGSKEGDDIALIPWDNKFGSVLLDG